MRLAIAVAIPDAAGAASFGERPPTFTVTIALEGRFGDNGRATLPHNLTLEGA